MPAQGEVRWPSLEVPFSRKSRTQLPFLYSRRAPPRKLKVKSDSRRQPYRVRILVGSRCGTDAFHGLAHRLEIKAVMILTVRRMGGEHTVHLTEGEPVRPKAGSDEEEGSAARRTLRRQLAGRVALLVEPEESFRAKRTNSNANFRRLILQYHAEWRGVTVADL